MAGLDTQAALLKRIPPVEAVTARELRGQRIQPEARRHPAHRPSHSYLRLLADVQPGSDPALRP
jgi:hypothetical protein